MFVPEGEALTFGEMEPDAKHELSHRARAFRKFADACLRGAGGARG
jgi:XTP/dITP diphosphohydrolase